MLHFVPHDKGSQTRCIAFGVPKPGLIRHKTPPYNLRTDRAVRENRRGVFHYMKMGGEGTGIGAWEASFLPAIAGHNGG